MATTVHGQWLNATHRATDSSERVGARVGGFPMTLLTATALVLLLTVVFGQSRKRHSSLKIEDINGVPIQELEGDARVDKFVNRYIYLIDQPSHTAKICFKLDTLASGQRTS